MKHRYLNTLVAALALATGGAVVSQSSTVNAAKHSVYSSYWNKNRKVKVKKTTTFRKFDALKRRYVKGKKTYKKGKVITVRAAGEFTGWVLDGTKSGSRYWWISEKGNTKWMTEYKKPKKPVKYYDDGFKGNTYTSLNGSKMSFDSITTFDVYEEQANGKREPQNKRIALLKGTFKNNGKTTTPKKFVNSNGIEVQAGSTVDSKKSLDFGGLLNPFESDYGEAKDYVKQTKTFTIDVDKGETVTFYAPISADYHHVNPTDTFTFFDIDDTSYTLKASDNKKIIFLSYERAYNLKNFPDVPDVTPPAHW